VMDVQTEGRCTNT